MSDSAARRLATLTAQLQPSQVTRRQRWPLTLLSAMLTLALSLATQAGRKSAVGALRHRCRCTRPEGLRCGCVTPLGGTDDWAAYSMFPDRACWPGAAGGIGQPLALLLKLSPRVHTLHLYDVVNTAGVKADISHINTTARVRDREVGSEGGARRGPLSQRLCQVRAFTGPAQLPDALSGCDLVVIPAGVPRKPGMTVR